MAITKLKRSKSKPQSTRSTLLKTNHLSLILGALLLSSGLTACSTNTSAQPLENTTTTQSPEQKAMTPEEEKMIATIKNIFKAMAEPGITPKALASRFGKLDPKNKSGNFSVPFDESFEKLKVNANPAFLGDVDLELANKKTLSIETIRSIFGDYTETPTINGHSIRIMYDAKLPEINQYHGQILVDYQPSGLTKDEFKNAQVISISLLLSQKID
jgi:hypothetical protein